MIILCVVSCSIAVQAEQGDGFEELYRALLVPWIHRRLLSPYSHGPLAVPPWDAPNVTDSDWAAVLDEERRDEEATPVSRRPHVQDGPGAIVGPDRKTLESADRDTPLQLAVVGRPNVRSVGARMRTHAVFAPHPHGRRRASRRL